MKNQQFNSKMWGLLMLAPMTVYRCSYPHSQALPGNYSNFCWLNKISLIKH